MKKELTIVEISQLMAGNIGQIANDIFNKYLSVDAVDAMYQSGILIFAAQSKSDSNTLIQFIQFFINESGNINMVNNQGYTMLDFINRSNLALIAFLRNNFGARHGREISNIQRQQAETQILPGYESEKSYQNLYGFSFETGHLERVSNAINLKSNTHYPQKIAVEDMLSKVYCSIGKLLDNDGFISTAFLIKNDWILTARHSVNERELEDLSVRFGKITIDISGVIETGASFGLDYVILKLSQPIPEINPLRLTLDNQSSSLLLVGYKGDEQLYFSAFSNSSSGELAITGYQETSQKISGSPYFNLAGEVCGLHLRASTTQKTGVYLNTILTKRLNSVLWRLILEDDVSNIPAYKIDCFQEFTGAIKDFGEFDEGSDPLTITFKMVNGFPYYEKTGRPDNQNSTVVQDKIAKRLKQLKSDGAVLTKIQNTFLKPENKHILVDNDINIAHNIAIKEIGDALIYRMNNKRSSLQKEAEEMKCVIDFADTIVSSDDESGPKRSSRLKPKLTFFFKTLRTKERQYANMSPQNAQVVAQKDAEWFKSEAKEIIKRINRRSKNLMPGYAKVNSSIGEMRDPHLIKINNQSNSDYKETALSKSLSEKVGAFFEHRQCRYEPKYITNNSEIKCMSSSVDSENIPGNAYVRIR